MARGVGFDSLRQKVTLCPWLWWHVANSSLCVYSALCLFIYAQTSEPCELVQAWNPSSPEVGAEDREFEASLGYRMRFGDFGLVHPSISLSFWVY